MSFYRTAPGITLDGVHATLLRAVENAVRAAGGVGVLVTSGYRDPQRNAGAGGVGRSNHLTGDALDGFAILPGGRQVPLGTFLKGNAGSFGLRSGDAPGFFNGQPDPVHVDDGANVGGGVSSSSNVSTLDGFFTLVAQDLGVKPTRGVLSFLKGWAAVEGTAAKNNPLATTLKTNGSVPLPGNSAGVQQYATPEEGARATAQTLKGYRYITAALKTGSPVVGGITNGLVRDFGTWSGGDGASYARKVFLNAQGNPKGSDASIGLWSKPDLNGAARHIPGVAQVEDVGAFLGKITDPHNILRGLQILAGGVLVLVGLVLLARQVALAADLPDPAGLAGKATRTAPAGAVE